MLEQIKKEKTTTEPVDSGVLRLSDSHIYICIFLYVEESIKY